MNRADRRRQAKKARHCKHQWVHKPSMTGLGIWCELCGIQVSTRPL